MQNGENNFSRIEKIDDYSDPFADIPVSESPNLSISQSKDLMLESKVNKRKSTKIESKDTIIAKVIFPPHYPVKQKSVGFSIDFKIEDCIKTISNILIKQNNYQTKDVGLCVKENENHPMEFKLLKFYPFFLESDSVKVYQQLIMNEPIYYTEKIIKDNKPVGLVRVRVKFPNNFPFVYKTFELDVNYSIKEARDKIAKNLNFKAGTVAMIGLRVPKDLILIEKYSEIEKLKNIDPFPFLNSEMKLGDYFDLIQQIVKKKIFSLFQN